ncbi:MAG: diguanylate cyclase [Chitinophagaceae bacterium]|nr:diguanylate cyclase [Oligoflexus sp.]
MSPQPTILFVLDTPKDETALRGAFESFYSLQFCHDPDQTLDFIARSKPAVVVLSFQTDLISPLAVAHVLRGDPVSPYIGLIYISQQDGNEWLDRAIMAGVDVCLPEGRTLLQTKTALESVLRLRQAKEEVAAINAKFHTAYQRFKSLSAVDEGNGLGNFHFLTNQLRLEFKRAQRYQKNLVLLLVRVDSLSEIQNLDPAQDKLLNAVAQTICRSVRFEIDTAGRARGAEFIVILPETDIDGAISVAERLREKVATLYVNEGMEQLATSVGLAHFCGTRSNFQTFEEFLDTATLAVQCAQHHGGDQYWALDTSSEDLHEERIA